MESYGQACMQALQPMQRSELKSTMPSLRWYIAVTGTDGDARRLLAMIAAGDLKNAAGVGKCSLLDVLHPGAVYGEGNVVLGFAGDGAGMAADALAVVDDESVSHPEVCSTRAPEVGCGLCIVSDRRFDAIDRLEAGIVRRKLFG